MLSRHFQAIIIAFFMIASIRGFASQKNPLTHSAFNIGTEIQNWHYEENRASGATIMKDYGILYGIFAEYNHITNFGLTLDSGIKFVQGSTSYEGGLQKRDGTYLGAYNSDSQNSIFEFESKLGYMALLSPKISVGIKAGYAFRTLHNPELEEVPYDYNRTAFYHTIPAAIEFSGRTSEKTILSFSTKMNFLLDAKTVSDNTSGGTTDYIQKKGIGFYSHLDFKLLGEGQLNPTSYGFRVFYRQWEFDDSELVSEGMTKDGRSYIFSREPRNTTKSIGGRLYVNF